MPEGMIYMYDVTVLPPWNRVYKRSDKKVYHDAIAKWKNMVPAIKDNPHAWVFDGCKQLYSTKKLSSDSFPELTRISLWDREDEREVAMVVRDVTRVADIRLYSPLLLSRPNSAFSSNGVLYDHHKGSYKGDERNPGMGVIGQERLGASRCTSSSRRRVEAGIELPNGSNVYAAWSFRTHLWQ